MAKNIELLLTENVEGTGIVGDVVKVRKGFARNFLLPRSMATKPSEEMIKSLAAKRADAQRMLAELRTQREEVTKKLAGYELTMIRSCNDQGILYAAITQHDLAQALAAAGFPGIKDREVRLGSTVKRVDKYEVHVKFESDLDALIKLTVNADRELPNARNDQPEPAAAAAAATDAVTPSEARPKDKGWGSSKPEGDDKPAKGDKPAKAEKSEKGEKAAKGEKSKK